MASAGITACIGPSPGGSESFRLGFPNSLPKGGFHLPAMEIESIKQQAVPRMFWEGRGKGEIGISEPRQRDDADELRR